MVIGSDMKLTKGSEHFSKPSYVLDFAYVFAFGPIADF